MKLGMSWGPPRIAGLVAGAIAAASLTAISPSHTEAAAPVRYADEVFSSVRAKKDLVYGRATTASGAEKLRLDLYRPAGDTRRNRPALIFVHGGDSTVDKGLKRNRRVPIVFARRGFVAATINYRSGTSGGTKEAQYDTRAAVRWFKANAARYGVNPKWIVVMGSSAGAINVLNVAFNPEDPGNSGHPGYSSTVAAAVAISGTDTEPQNIGSNEAPIAMVHAVDDATIPIAAARETCSHTQAMGNVCEFFQYPQGGHPPGFLNQNREQIADQVSGFLCRNVLGSACR